MKPLDANRIAAIFEQQIDAKINRLQNRTYKRGVVTAVSGAKADVEIEGNPVATQGIPSLVSYVPHVGDKVVILSIGTTGANLLILGSLTDDSATPRISRDANNWTIYDYGAYKEYKKDGRISQAINAGQWKTVSTIAMPSIDSVNNEVYLDGTFGCSDSAVGCSIYYYTPNIYLQAANHYGGNISVVYSYSLTIKTSPLTPS